MENGGQWLSGILVASSLGHMTEFNLIVASENKNMFFSEIRLWGLCCFLHFHYCRRWFAYELIILPALHPKCGDQMLIIASYCQFLRAFD